MSDTRSDDDGRLAKEHADRGHEQWKRGHCSVAIEHFTRALVVAPDDAWTLMRRGAARAAIDDVPGATEDLQRALTLLGEDAHSRRHWAHARIGEAIRWALRDAVIAPDAPAAEVEALLARFQAARDAFTEALHEDPSSAWTHAHRGAVTILAHWLAARAGVDAERTRAYAESAARDLEEALRLDASYSWAMVFQAFLLTVKGSNTLDEAARHALFDRAAAHAEAAGRLRPSYPTRRALAEFALYKRDAEAAVEHGWARLAEDPEDLIARYCLAQSLDRLAHGSTEAESAVTEARRATAAAVIEQARRAMLAKRARTAAMLGGLAMLAGQYDVAAVMLGDVLDYPDMDTLVFMRGDPAWDAARAPGPAEGALKGVREAYARLFPRS